MVNLAGKDNQFVISDFGGFGAAIGSNAAVSGVSSLASRFNFDLAVESTRGLVPQILKVAQDTAAVSPRMAAMGNIDRTAGKDGASLA
jgi:hypothetical protein